MLAPVLAAGWVRLTDDLDGIVAHLPGAPATKW